VVISALAMSACVTTAPDASASPTRAAIPSAKATVPVQTPSQTTTAANASPCFAPPPPTYLPWGAIGAPQRITVKPGVVMDHYVGPAIMPGPIGTNTTQLEFNIGRARPQDLNEDVLPVPPRLVAGRSVVIYRIGDPGVGMVGARWQEGMDGCDYIAGLYWPRGSASDEDEIAKIIASLDVWAAARAQLPATVAVLRPTYLPSRFRDPPWLLSLFDSPQLGPRYLIGYRAGAESLHFALGPVNSSPPTFREPTTIRGTSGMLMTSQDWPAIGAYWTEGGHPYAIQDGSIATREEILRIISALAAL